MNRREFCLSIGLAATGSVFAETAEEMRACATKNVFHAKKIFLRRWNDEFGYETVSHQTEILRQKLSRFRDEFDTVIVFPDGVTESFFERFRQETDSAGIAVFVPTPLNFPVPNRFEAVRFLESSAEKIIETEKTSAEGVLFSEVEKRRLVLFDPSRCLWTCFSDDTVTPSPTPNVRFSRLAIAHFLDRLIEC